MSRPEVAAQKWNVVKIVCNQPFKFNHDVFGLSMLVILGQVLVLLLLILLLHLLQAEESKENHLASPGARGMASFVEKLGRVSSPLGRSPSLTSTLQVKLLY